jgi:hypothetical protein
MDSNNGTWQAELRSVDRAEGLGATVCGCYDTRRVWNALNAVRREQVRAEAGATGHPSDLRPPCGIEP